jgi:hypothetical protein
MIAVAKRSSMAGRDREFMTAVEEGAAELNRFLREQMIRRPYATMGRGAVLGYALGGGLTIRMSALLLRAAARVAMVRAVQELMPSCRKDDPSIRTGGSQRDDRQPARLRTSVEASASSLAELVADPKGNTSLPPLPEVG